MSFRKNTLKISLLLVVVGLLALCALPSMPDFSQVSNLTYSANPAVYFVGDSIYPNKLSVYGVLSHCTIEPTLPDSLIFDTLTGRITGKPMRASPITRYLITAYGSASSDTGSLFISVIDTNTHSTVNRAPQWNQKNITKTIAEGDSLFLALADSCQDPDVGNTVNFSILASGSQKGILSGSNYKFTASFSDSGHYSVKIKGSDGLLSDTLTFSLIVTNVNQRPRFITQPGIKLNIAQGKTDSIAYPLLAQDTIDNDVVTLAIDTAKSKLPTGAQAVLLASKRVSIAVPANAATDSTYSVLVKASDLGNAFDTLRIKLTVFDPTAADTIKPTIDADPSNPASGAVLSDSTVQLRFTIQDFNGIYRAGYIRADAPADSHITTGSSGNYVFPVTLKHGSNSIKVFAIDNSSRRNAQAVNLTLVYNRLPILTLLSPLNGESGIAKTQQLRWSSKDPDNDRITNQVLFGTLSDQLEVVKTSTDTFYTLPTFLSDGGTYFWRIVSTDSISSVSSAIRSFKTNNLPSATLTSPLDNVQNIGIPTYLSWSGTDNDAADISLLKYSLYVAKGTGSYQRLIKDTSATSCLLRGLEYSTLYRWKIVVKDSRDSTVSSERSFTTKAPESRLDSLAVIGGVLSPVFNRDSLRYSISIPANQDTVRILGIPLDSSAKVTIAGSTSQITNSYKISGLNFGLNVVSVVITLADNATIRTYTINIVRNSQTWQKVYGSGNPPGGRGIVQCSDSGYLLLGQIEDPADIYAIRTTKNGDTLWTKKIDITSYDVGTFACQGTAGGFVVTGSDGWTGVAVFLDSLGQVTRTTIVPGIVASGIVPYSGGYMVASTTTSGSGDMIISQLNLAGDSQPRFL